jgi:hypothetical protein
MTHATGCLKCGADLIHTDEYRPATCIYCGTATDSNTFCREGHFVCDDCHRHPAIDWIEQHCLRTTERDPIALANELMSHPSVKMHGPEHHFLVPAALLTAWHNQRGTTEARASALHSARKRAEHLPGGTCGYWGACGAAVGTGIFLSVITRATPLTTDSWSLSNRITSETLALVADLGGPRCCKRDTFLSIRHAVEFVSWHLRVEFSAAAEPVCTFFLNNKECLDANCPFHPAGQG